MTLRFAYLAAWMAISTTIPALAANGSDASGVTPQHVQVEDAKLRSDATSSMILGATLAGTRIVAVGEHGTILLSDDNGGHFHQARHVPADATLTAVTFSDVQHGWAVGHWGVVLHTDDGGETWRLQRSDVSVDQPLFSVAFLDDRHGWAVGLWSLMLETDDGGATWHARQVESSALGSKGGLNLFSVFSGPTREVYIAAEQGVVYKSVDEGVSWQKFSTGYRGTLWSGAIGQDGTVYVGGLRGKMFASRNGGETWSAVSTGVGDSITDIVAARNGVAAVALDGWVTFQRPGSGTFDARQRPGREALTALVLTRDGVPVLFSEDGVVAK